MSKDDFNKGSTRGDSRARNIVDERRHLSPSFFVGESARSADDSGVEEIKAGLQVFADHPDARVRKFAKPQVAIAQDKLTADQKGTLGKAMRALNGIAEPLKIHSGGGLYSCDAVLFSQACDEYKITKPAWLVEFEGKAATIDGRSGQSDGSDHIGQQKDGKGF